MRYLGIDYGRKKIGLAVAQGKLSEPFKVVREENMDKTIERIVSIIKELGIEKVVVGVSEGEMAKESILFTKNLRAKVSIPVETSDETLTSFDAINMSIEAGIKRKKRKTREDAFAASIMLQNYLDRNN